MIFEAGRAIQGHWQRMYHPIAVRRGDGGGIILNMAEGERKT